jgi:carboxypeptidase Taq
MARLSRINQAVALLGWDQQTYMPPGGAEARAEQLATLSELTHEMFVSDETGNLLATCESDLKGADPESDDVRMLAVIRRDYDHETKLPTDLVMDLARQSTLGQEIWMRARENNDFKSFAPALEKMMDLTRRQAECLGYKDHIYDALIDLYEPGFTQAHVAAMFADVKPFLVELTQSIGATKRPVDDSPIHGAFPIDKQREITLQVVKQIGFDLTRGRQDEAAHPFCQDMGRDDVRLTTRFDPAYLGQAFYASLHEAGHGMYEQGSSPDYEGSALAGGVSLGIHESQSRMWENLVGRSRAFSQWVFPQLQAAFPSVLGSISAEDYYRAVNKVEPSLIRIEADEVTYNLHILLRFELECDLLTGSLAVADLPAAWNARMERYLGVVPPDDASGVLQDIHWSGGLIGYFPTYSIGNLVSAQLWHAANAALPDLNADLAKGEFAPLLQWLRTNVHQYGKKYLPDELIRRATGEPLTSKYYTDYLKAKFTDIYG